MPLWNKTKNNMISIIKETKAEKSQNLTKIDTVSPDKY